MEGSQDVRVLRASRESLRAIAGVSVIYRCLWDKLHEGVSYSWRGYRSQRVPETSYEAGFGLRPEAHWKGLGHLDHAPDNAIKVGRYNKFHSLSPTP